MKNDNLFPEQFFELVFFSKEEYSLINYKEESYLTIGRDRDIKTNFIAVADDGKVYYISCDENDKCYISVNKEVFAKEIFLFKDYISEKRNIIPENPDDSQLKEFTDTFREKISELDCNALYSENTFWSEICEEMEYGLIV